MDNYLTQVAFIITVYKNDKLEFFKEAINSIINQDYGFDNINIYLGIDGELPNTIQEYINENSFLFYKVIQNKENKGLAFTLNRIIEILENEEYIFRMVADDICKIDRVSKQMAFMEVNQNIKVKISKGEKLLRYKSEIGFKEGILNIKNTLGEALK